MERGAGERVTRPRRGLWARRHAPQLNLMYSVTSASPYQAFVSVNEQMLRSVVRERQRLLHLQTFRKGYISNYFS